MRLLFGDRAELADVYAHRLATAGVERGLIGPREVPRIWERHLGNCVVVAPLVPPDAAVADVGSGAGLPGLVLAIARPDIRVTLVEPLLRRTTFLNETVLNMGLSNVTVRRDRAEDVADEFDIVTSRAVAPLARLAAWCLPLAGSTGTVLALKGSSATQELREAEDVLVRLGARSWTVETVGGEHLDTPTTVVRIESGARSFAGGLDKSVRRGPGTRLVHGKRG